MQKNQGGGSGVADKHVKLKYNALGQAQTITRFSNYLGTTEVGHSDYEYDKFAHLIGLDHETPPVANTLLAGYDWAYDNLNRVKSLDFVPAGFATEDVNAYSYDATDQLIVTDRTTAPETARAAAPEPANRKHPFVHGSHACQTYSANQPYPPGALVKNHSLPAPARGERTFHAR